MAEPEQIRGASVTSRALSVLGAFEGSSGSLTVARIAARAKLPLSTTYRMVHELFDLTHENVHLAIREGTQSLYVDKIYSSRKMPQVSRIGGRLPLHATAVGRVLLAAQPDWFVDAYLQRELEAPTPKTVTDPRILTQLIDDVRRDGYSVTIEQMRMSALSVARPVVFNGQAVAALGLVFEAHRYREVQRFMPQLRGTVERIEFAMAGRPLTIGE
jgi:DNA-binding IclR family transcriptional regulator